MPPTDSPALLRRALHLFVRPVARRAGLTFAGAVAVALAAAVEPLVLRHLVDFLAALGGRPAAVRAADPATLRSLWTGVGAVALVMALRTLGGARTTVGVWKVRLGIEYQLRSRVAAKFSVLSSRTQAEIGTGGLRYAIEQSAPQTAVAFTDVAYRLVPTLAYVAVAATGMLHLEPSIATAVLCLVPLPAGVAALASRRQTARARAHHSYFTRLWAWYDEVLHGMGTVRAFANERAEERRFMRRTRWAFASIHRGVHTDAQVTAAAGIAELAARATVLGYGGWLVVRGELSLGALLALWGYVGGVFAPVGLLVEVYPALRRARVALDAVFRVLEAEEEAPDLPDAVPAPALAGRVTFQAVSFGYDERPGAPGARRALDAFDVDIAPGETVALVGPSGSGKSTVLRLLQRVHQPSAGRVLLDGLDLRGLQAASVRRQLGVVPQEVVLFAGSVAANIAYGRPSATRAEVEAAARAANAHDFIMDLPGGYEHRVAEAGRGLSGGQRQRIAIARAFLIDPAVLLLDEATAALDTESERLVQEALRALRRGRTTLVVAHRLNTIRDADRILVLRDGRVVGDGPTPRCSPSARRTSGSCASRWARRPPRSSSRPSVTRPERTPRRCRARPLRPAPRRSGAAGRPRGREALPRTPPPRRRPRGAPAGRAAPTSARRTAPAPSAPRARPRRRRRRRPRPAGRRRCPRGSRRRGGWSRTTRSRRGRTPRTSPRPRPRRPRRRRGSRCRRP
jgi:ATP-binding cassette subfamily B protein